MLPIYAIRVFAMQELRWMPGNDPTHESLGARLTNFELSIFDNYKPFNVEYVFKARLH